MLCCGMKWNENVLMFFVFCHHGVVQGMDYVSPICLGKVILVFKSHRFGQGNWYSKAHMLGEDPPERLVWPLCPAERQVWHRGSHAPLRDLCRSILAVAQWVRVS